MVLKFKRLFRNLETKKANLLITIPKFGRKPEARGNGLKFVGQVISDNNSFSIEFNSGGASYSSSVDQKN